MRDDVYLAGQCAQPDGQLDRHVDEHKYGGDKQYPRPEQSDNGYPEWRQQLYVDSKPGRLQPERRCGYPQRPAGGSSQYDGYGHDDQQLCQYLHPERECTADGLDGRVDENGQQHV